MALDNVVRNPAATWMYLLFVGALAVRLRGQLRSDAESEPTVRRSGHPFLKFWLALALVYLILDAIF